MIASNWQNIHGDLVISQPSKAYQWEPQWNEPPSPDEHIKVIHQDCQILSRLWEDTCHFS